MRRYLLLGATAGLLVVPALAFGRVTTAITVEDGGFSQFGPKVVRQSVGAGDIHWQWDQNGKTFAAHDVKQDSNLFSSGPATNNKPAGFTIVPSAGRFHYYCTIHGSRHGGMDGTIKVKPAIFKQKARSFGVKWSPGTNDTGNAFDVRYRVDGRKWKTWKNDTTKPKGKFGARRKPVRVRAGHTYDVAARSEKKRKTKKHSRWSPAARVQT
jgi:plastocyanin